jgi:hypothetical protein
MLRLDLGCTSWIPRIPAGPRLVVSRRFHYGFARVDLMPPAKLCAKLSSLGYSSVIVPELLYLFLIVCFEKALGWLFCPPRLAAGWKPALHLFGSVQCQIEYKDIHPRFTQETELTPFSILIDQGNYRRFTQAACSGYAGDLVECCR